MHVMTWLYHLHEEFVARPIFRALPRLTVSLGTVLEETNEGDDGREMCSLSLSLSAGAAGFFFSRFDGDSEASSGAKTEVLYVAYSTFSQNFPRSMSCRFSCLLLS
jgi:hypothetical protein